MKLFIAIVIFWLPGFCVNAQDNGGSTLASKQAWDAVFKAVEWIPGRSVTERDRIDFWEKGLELWKKYPDDSRRYEWLSWAGSRQKAIQFYLNPAIAESSPLMQKKRLPIDNAAKEAWERQYMQLRAELFNDRRVLEKDKAEFWHYELFNKTLDSAKNAIAYRAEEGKVDTKRIAKEVYEFYAQYPWYWKKTNNAFSYFTLYAVDEFGLRDPKNMRKFLRAFKENPNQHLVNYVSGYERILMLHTEPFELKFSALEDGRRVDLKDYRGKIVFVDMWNTGCFSCIDAMPKYQKLYEKYRSYGFEVVGLCLDTDDNRQRALNVINKTGTTWPTYFSGGGKEDYDQGKGVTAGFMKKYAITGFPFRLLLDKEGKLIAQQPALETFEATIQEALGLTSVSNNGQRIH